MRWDNREGHQFHAREISVSQGTPLQRLICARFARKAPRNSKRDVTRGIPPFAESANYRPLHPGIRSAARAYVPGSEHLPNDRAQRSHHQPLANWVYEVVNQQRAEPGKESRRGEHQKTQQAKHRVLPDTSYRKPKQEGRQHSRQRTCSHRKQPKKQPKENHEAGRHRLILALSNEDLVPPNGALSRSLA
jgi:hypothetical protein